MPYLSLTEADDRILRAVHPGTRAAASLLEGFGRLRTAPQVHGAQSSGGLIPHLDLVCRVIVDHLHLTERFPPHPKRIDKVYEDTVSGTMTPRAVLDPSIVRGQVV